jgi:hypothetical protein
MGRQRAHHRQAAPAALFIGVGLFYIEPSRLTTLPPISLNQISTAALLLIFIFGGFDVVGTPRGRGGRSAP